MKLSEKSECLRKQLSAKSRTRTEKDKKREIKGPEKRHYLNFKGQATKYAKVKI